MNVMTNIGPATCCVYTKNRFDSMDDNDDTDALDIDGEEEDNTDRKSTRLNSSHITPSRMPSSA